MCRGSLVEWVLSDGTTAKATLNQSSIELGQRIIMISCNDCEKKSLAPYHFLGLECRHCRGFNTSKA